jgi:hypothetical protein
MKKVMVVVVAVLCMMAGSVSAEVRALWSMNDGAGSIVTDSIAGNNAAIIGDVTWNGAGSGPGGVGNSLHFNGGYAEALNSSAFNVGTNNFTVSWDMRSTNNAFMLIFNRGNDVRYECYAYSDGTMNGELDPGGVWYNATYLAVPQTAFITGQWVHVDMVTDRTYSPRAPLGTVALYADGVKIGSQLISAGGSFDEALPFVIGNGVDTGYTTPYYGDLANLKLEVVPEPASLILLGLGGIAVLRRKLKK